jgi:hypothetical protein
VKKEAAMDNATAADPESSGECPLAGAPAKSIDPVGIGIGIAVEIAVVL